MRYCFDAVNAKAGLWLAPFVVTGLLSLPVIAAPVASATDTSIGVSICGDNVPAAQIDITEPNDDSIVAQAETTFRGTVANATQIEVTVDGQYNNTISITTDDTAFETVLTLSAGTHTITMTANAICGAPDADESIVLTYQPAVEPSHGGGVPTDVRDEVSPRGVVIADDTIRDDQGASPIVDLPFIGGIANIAQDFGAIIGLDSTIHSNDAPLTVGIVRVGLTVAALTSVVMASTLAPIAAQAIPGLSEVFSASSHRSMIYLGWVIRGAGLLAMALAYFI